MSRTYKDRPTKVRFPEEYPFHRDCEVVNVERYSYNDVVHNWKVYVQLPTTKTKKRKTLDTEWHWLRATPSSWNRIMHTKPLRARVRNWVYNTSKLVDIEDVDVCPDFGNKPHQYYY